MNKLFKKNLLLAIMALVLLFPTLALADQFTLSGQNSLKVQSGGHLDPYWTPITESSPSDTSLLGLPASIVSRINLFDATGVSSFSQGDTFSGLSYSVPGDFVVADGGVAWNRPARNDSGYGILFSGGLTLTSLSFHQDGISITGYLDNLYVNPLTTSSVLLSFAGAQSAIFTMDIFSSSKTSQDFITTLNSAELSTWAGHRTTIAATPEPASLLLLASAFGAWGLRRKGFRGFLRK